LKYSQSSSYVKEGLGIISLATIGSLLTSSSWWLSRPQQKAEQVDICGILLHPLTLFFANIGYILMLN